MDDIAQPPHRPLQQMPKEDEPSEPEFTPPEKVAEQEELESKTNKVSEDVGLQEDKPKVKKSFLKRRIDLHMPHGKKQWFLTILAVLIFVGGIGAAWWFLVYNSPGLTSNNVKSSPYPAPKPKTEASKLSGLQVDPQVNKRPVTAVMIENSVDARPQSGLKDAGVVFEAVAEGGITRFVALFQDTQPDYIGPIRSVRPYYIDWFLPFDASIAHVGGSPKGLSDLKSLNAKDLDQFANSGSYDRITQRYAPHNVYTSIAKLNELEIKKGFTSANFTGFERKKEEPAKTLTANSIDLNISSFNFNVHYVYDGASNTYKRSEGGTVHIDEKSGSQLAPKVVVAVVMQRGIDGDGQHTDYTTTGSGKVYVFQDGIVTEGTWTKTSRSAQWTFVDANNKPLKFNPGQTWFSMVDTAGSVTYVP